MTNSDSPLVQEHGRKMIQEILGGVALVAYVSVVMLGLWIAHGFFLGMAAGFFGNVEAR